MTNYEKFKTMTEDEIAEYLVKLIFAYIIKLSEAWADNPEIRMITKESLLEILRAEASEE